MCFTGKKKLNSQNFHFIISFLRHTPASMLFFIFFLSGEPKFPCWDPPTIEYSECGLVTSQVFYILTCSSMMQELLPVQHQKLMRKETQNHVKTTKLGIAYMGAGCFGGIPHTTCICKLFSLRSYPAAISEQNSNATT